MSDNFEHMVTQMMEFASCDRQTAITHLSAANHNLEVALRNFFDGANVETNEPRIQQRRQPASNGNRLFLSLWELFTMPIRLPLVFIFGFLDRIYTKMIGNGTSGAREISKILDRSQIERLIDSIQRSNRPLLVITAEKNSTKADEFLEDETFKTFISGRFAGGTLYAVSGTDLASVCRSYRVITPVRYFEPNVVHCIQFDDDINQYVVNFAAELTSPRAIMDHASAAIRDDVDARNQNDHVQNRILADRELMRQQNEDYERARQIDEAAFAARRLAEEQAAQRRREEEEAEERRQEALAKLALYKEECKEYNKMRQEQMADGKNKAKIRYPDGTTTIFVYDDTARTLDLFNHIFANPGFEELFEAFQVSKRQILPLVPERIQAIAIEVGSPFEDRHKATDQLLSELGLHPAGESISISNW